MKTILSKAEFAQRMRRSRSCVSGWIAAGKISSEALVGDGREAKIWLERAEADLAASLDPSQQAAQAAPILKNLTGPSSGGTDRERRSTPATEPANAPLSERERDLARRAKADADKAEHDAEAARRKLALDEGRYVMAEEAAAAWRRELADVISQFERFATHDLPREIAECHGLDWKTLTKMARERFRQFRSDISDVAKARREAMEAE